MLSNQKMNTKKCLQNAKFFEGYKRLQNAKFFECQKKLQNAIHIKCDFIQFFPQKNVNLLQFILKQLKQTLTQKNVLFQQNRAFHISNFVFFSKTVMLKNADILHRAFHHSYLMLLYGIFDAKCGSYTRNITFLSQFTSIHTLCIQFLTDLTFFSIFNKNCDTKNCLYFASRISHFKFRIFQQNCDAKKC
eukprot:TRINITY_DN2427_c0_g1_i1.p1 TRINITY_DN2427_c0_g1~~TRINITY_DN2427_c0_g1_i1.p1  ORF type:complete len:190 (-),score=-13.18 TRINITY_DN2427_c0_g1_i1:89-658(-)